MNEIIINTPFNKSVIENEINSFINIIYKDTLYFSKSELTFIHNNKLHKPKENYIFLFNFLDNTTNIFIKSDYKIEIPIIKKLRNDIAYTKKIYAIQKKAQIDIDDIFNNQFINKSNILNLVRDNKRSYEKLYSFYNELFLRLFKEKRKKLINNLLIILNSKIFYLDRLLWIEANKSETIKKYLKVIKVQETINSKKYIIYKLKHEIHSKNYLYLEKCLRIYK